MGVNSPPTLEVFLDPIAVNSAPLIAHKANEEVFDGTEGIAEVHEPLLADKTK